MDVTQPIPRKRTGSDKRRRIKSWKIALTVEEEAIAISRAQTAGLSRSSYGRFALIGDAGTRARRTPPSKSPELGRAVAAVNRVGGNLRQLTAIFDAAAARVIAERCRAAHGEAQAAVRTILEIASGRGARLENPAQVDSATEVLKEAGRRLDSVLHRLNAGSADVTTQEAQAAIAEVHAALITLRQILRPAPKE
jgi:hypothetical protein